MCILAISLNLSGFIRRQTVIDNFFHSTIFLNNMSKNLDELTISRQEFIEYVLRILSLNPSTFDPKLGCKNDSNLAKILPFTDQIVFIKNWIYKGTYIAN